jgi:hypothetical protein
MTPEQRREKIMSLLSQCRVDETERLHSGRATIPAHPISFYAEKIEALFADDAPSSPMPVTRLAITRAKVKAAQEWYDAECETPVAFGGVDDALSSYHSAAEDFFDAYDIQQEMEGSRPLRERYEDALEVVRKQALCIEELEAKQTLFQDVMGASANYVTRFGGELTREGTQRKVDEEIAEFKEAAEDLLFDQNQVKILSLHDVMYPSQFWEDNAAQELIDCLVTLGGMASFARLKWPTIEQAARDTLAKLDKRTPETHQWNDDTKTVERIGKTVKS